MEPLGCGASVMFPREKQTNPSTNSALPELIDFLAEPYGQSPGMIFPQELSIPLWSVVPTPTPSPPPSGAWGDAEMQGTWWWGIGMGYLGSNEMDSPDLVLAAKREGAGEGLRVAYGGALQINPVGSGAASWGAGSTPALS